MPISVYVDNNVWDFLFERKMDLSVELPRDEYCICLTREAEFEIPPIPDEKAELKAFIQETIKKCVVQTRPYFGFADPALPLDEQRVGGLDQGYWISKEELDFIVQQKFRLGSVKRPTKLFKNEADISLAARSLHSVVLTLEKGTGPLNDAYKQGGMVIFLTEFDTENLSLSEFIKARLSQQTGEQAR